VNTKIATQDKDLKDKIAANHEEVNTKIATQDKDLKDKIAANHKEVNTKIATQDKDLKDKIAANRDKLSQVGIRSRVITGTARGDDSIVDLKCNTGEFIAGCSCHGAWKNCDGPKYISITQCHVYSGASEPITASATCISLQM
jgi:rRNA-processing protein FCF1